MRKFYLVAILLIFATNLFAESKKMVLVEEYSSAYCGTCGIFDPTFKAITTQNINDVIPISFHTGNQPGDIMYKHNTTVSGRFLYTYGISTIGTPAVWIDGNKVNYTNYNTLSSYTGGMSPITLKVIEDRTPDKLNITVGVESDVALEAHRLQVYIVEDNLYYANAGNNGVKNFRWVVRKGFPSDQGTGQALNIGTNGKQAFNYSIDWHPEWNKDNIHVVAFVQSYKQGDNLKVAQAGKTGEYTLEALIASDSEVDFGDISERDETEIIIKNNGLKELKIESIALENNPDEVFNIKFGTSIKSIPAYGEAKVIVEFFPKENGDYSADLVINSDANNSANHKISLKGKSTNIVPFPQISSVSSLVFGEVSTEKTMNLEVSNVGTGELTIESIEIADDEEGVYSLGLENNSNITINLGEKLTIPVTFKPKEEKFYFADIVIKSDSKTDSEFKIALDGTGKDILTNENLVLSEGGTSVNLGSIEPGSNKTIKITNTGDVEIKANNIYFSDKVDGSGDSDAFVLISSNTTWFVPNLETSIAFRFNPSEDKEYNVVLNIETEGEEADLAIDVMATANFASVFGNELTDKGLLELNVLPNPISENSVIEFKNNSTENLELTLFNSNGEVVKTLFNGLSNSVNTLNLNSSELTSGKYFIVAQIGNKKEAFSVIVTK